MKTIKIETFNGANKIEQSFELHQATGINKILGTSLNRIFEFNELLRDVNSKGIIKASDNLAVIISVDGVTEIDTYKLTENVNVKLSFGKSAKSKKRFAQNMKRLLDWSVNPVKVTTIDELINSLE